MAREETAAMPWFEDNRLAPTLNRLFGGKPPDHSPEGRSLMRCCAGDATFGLAAR